MNMSQWSERYSALKVYIRNGTIKRMPCVECGDPKTDAHHEDYSKPLDVVWLCRKHHKARHPNTGLLKDGVPWNRKLTADQVIEIRESKEPARAIAPRYGIHHRTVHQIRSRETWKNAENDKNLATQPSNSQDITNNRILNENNP